MIYNAIQKIITLFLFLTLFSSSVDSSETKGPYLVLKNPTDPGMFSVFASVLGVLNHYENGNFSGLNINLDSGRYLDLEKGPNWWEYFFEPIKIGDDQAKKYYFTRQDFLGYLTKTAYPHRRERAAQLINKYVHLKPHIQQELDLFFNKNMKGHFIIGVHHRGTDKVTEVPTVPYEMTYKKLKKVIKKLPRSDRKNVCIYVATDDQAFLSYLLKKVSYKIVYSDFARSSNDKPLHGYNNNFYKNNYEMGREALLDCLLLSKSNVLIRPGSSGLSGIAASFNPNLTLINLFGVK